MFKEVKNAPYIFELQFVPAMRSLSRVRTRRRDRREYEIIVESGVFGTLQTMAWHCAQGAQCGGTLAIRTDIVHLQL